MIKTRFKTEKEIFREDARCAHSAIHDGLNVRNSQEPMQNVSKDNFNSDYKELKGVMLGNETKRLEDGKKAQWKTKEM